MSSPTVGVVDIEVRAGTVDDVNSLAPLRAAMVEHPARSLGQQWPVRGPEQAWALRKQEYRTWLEEASGFLVVAGSSDYADPVG